MAVPSQQTIDYYRPLLADHVRTILESGLLLDEDYEVLLNASNFKIYSTKSHGIPFRLILTGLGCVASAFAAKKFDRPLLLLPSLGAALVLLCLERRALLRRRRHQDIAKRLVKAFRKVRELNTFIIRYLKARRSSKEDLLIYHANVKEFVVDFLKRNATYFKCFLNKQLSFLAQLTKVLADDYETIKEISIDSLLIISDVDDNYELRATRVQDVNTFLSSKYLNYLGLTLCNINNARELELVLDKKLPCALATLDQLTTSTQKEFNNLRYCMSKKMEIEAKSRNNYYFPRKISGKLQQTLIGALNNLSIIMEKAQAVLGKVHQDIEDDGDVKKLESALGELRAHAFATYESLDVLCKLYGIFLDANNKKSRTKNVVQQPSKIHSDHDGTVATVHHDDLSEALEENYELYIPKTEEVDDTEITCQDQASGMTYLNLMLKELKQSLKQHERFIAARSKRGIADDDNDDEDDDGLRPNKTLEVVPKFDLKAVNMRDQELMPVPAPRASKMPPPPPPPPPPAPIDFSEAVWEPQRTLFESVRDLSSQLKGGEDVFGEDCSSDSD